MVALPEQVFELVNDKGSSKILGTRTSEGDVHLINVGGSGALDPETIFIGEIFMKASSENLRLAQKEGTRASLLISKGMESYEIQCKVKDHVTSGPVFDKMKETFAQMKFDLKGLWLLTPDRVWNESPTWDGSRRMV
ncbi:MAG: hypothetical protein GX369_01780 [Euryarchaeota archaeon]|nr:hypothetical protein [Euryarchaeota archaeon]